VRELLFKPHCVGMLIKEYINKMVVIDPNIKPWFPVPVGKRYNQIKI
jgi:hypothetical protein